MRNTIAKEIEKAAKNDPKFFLISGDAGLGVWEDFIAQSPKQYINPGVNEALCVGMSAGLALANHRVVYYNIAPFVIMRPFEQVRNDICYQNLPVILIGTGSGLTYAPAGITHYALEDITLASAMPNLQIFSPADPFEAKAAFSAAMQSNRPSYIRIPKAGEPNLHKSELRANELKKPLKLREFGKDSMNLIESSSAITSKQAEEIESSSAIESSAKDSIKNTQKADKIALISHSSITQEALNAAEILEKRGFFGAVFSMPFVNAASFEPSALADLGEFSHLFILEEHFMRGGLGSILSQDLAQSEIKSASKITQTPQITTFGVPNHFVHSIFKQPQILEHFELTAPQIAAKIEKILR